MLRVSAWGQLIENDVFGIYDHCTHDIIATVVACTSPGQDWDTQLLSCMGVGVAGYLI